jgi:hypothetical protein
VNDGCSHCGGFVDKPKAEKTRAIKNNWKIFCSLKCFRASQTKYAGLSSKDRQKMYDKKQYKNLQKPENKEKRDEIIRRRRERRRENPQAAREAGAKWRRNSLERYIAEFRRGNVTIDELNRRLSETFIRLDERLEAVRRINAEERGGDSETVGEPGQGKA